MKQLTMVVEDVDAFFVVIIIKKFLLVMKA
jgi:hypothetical protein